MSYIRGESREQGTLFPEALEDLIAEHAQVRVIDAFVNQLPMVSLGFGRSIPAATGRPGYDPSDLLKLYVYGYLNQVRSSRGLEREAGRNVEVLWLLNKLRPDFKTIADFRRDNVAAIVGACRAFTLFCREQGLFGAELIAIDGSKFQAVASRKQVWTKERVAHAQAQIDQRIGEYLTQLDQHDEQEPSVSSDAMKSALQALQQQRERLHILASQVSTQYVASEPEAKLMRTSNQGYQVAYNVQTAVDAKHALIAAFSVTNRTDDHQLAPMARLAKEILDVPGLTVLADAGYQNGEQAAECEAHGITPVVPAQRVVNTDGLFSKDHFSYEAESNTYRCPADQTLRRYKTDLKRRCHYYTSKACPSCPLRDRCTASQQRSIARSFFALPAERMSQRAKDQPDLMKRRKAIVEHPFAGMKYLMGTPRFLVRGLTKVSAEIALTVCGYNLKRTMNVLGAAAMMKAWVSA